MKLKPKANIPDRNLPENDSATGNAAPEAVHKNHASYFVPGLQRGLRVLEIVAAAGRPLAIAEIANELGLSRSSVFRLIYTLRHMGFLHETENTRLVTLGPRVLNIGFAYLASKDIIELARPDLELLRDSTGVSAHLAIRDERDVLYLACVQTRSGFLSNMNVGSRVPAYASPMGWILLADLSASALHQLFLGQTFRPLTDQTPRDVASLAARISEALSNGYVVSRGVLEKGGSSVSAPIIDKSGKVVAAINISGPDSAFNLAEMEGRYRNEVVAAARHISAKLGYHRPAP
ncbi:MAG: IclR family transcriptional regulator [Salinarimonadaceae bacterium]|nr:MAG: IclR family transcriptional regulator [Salinarimonadaceae bacterium]